jgi:hypothetical protein
MTMLDLLRCDLIALCFLLLFELACVVVVSWGIVGTVRLIVASVAGRPFQIRPRSLLVAAAIVVVPLCLFEIVTWYPELSERSLQGRTAPEVIERAGYPSYDSRKEPDVAPPGDFHLAYYRGLKVYRVEFHEDRVVKVVSYDSDK